MAGKRSTTEPTLSPVTVVLQYTDLNPFFGEFRVLYKHEGLSLSPRTHVNKQIRHGECL